MPVCLLERSEEVPDHVLLVVPERGLRELERHACVRLGRLADLDAR